MRIENVSMKQTTLDQFNEPSDQREALRRIHENHISKMEQVFNEIFSKLFDGEKYVQRV
jgi:predicted HAD superfamily phosphohydrolase